MKPYDDNKRKWAVGDIVIHKADAKKAFMLMVVVRVQKNGRIVTRYISPGLIWAKHRNVPFWAMPRYAQRCYGKTWKNPLSELLDPADFEIDIPRDFDRYWEVIS